MECVFSAPWRNSAKPCLGGWERPRLAPGSPGPPPMMYDVACLTGHASGCATTRCAQQQRCELVLIASTHTAIIASPRFSVATQADLGTRALLAGRCPGPRRQFSLGSGGRAVLVSGSLQVSRSAASSSPRPGRPWLGAAGGRPQRQSPRKSVPDKRCPRILTATSAPGMTEWQPHKAIGPLCAWRR